MLKFEFGHSSLLYFTFFSEVKIKGYKVRVKDLGHGTMSKVKVKCIACNCSYSGLGLSNAAKGWL